MYVYQIVFCHLIAKPLDKPSFSNSCTVAPRAPWIAAAALPDAPVEDVMRHRHDSKRWRVDDTMDIY